MFSFFFFLIFLSLLKFFNVFMFFCFPNFVLYLQFFFFRLKHRGSNTLDFYTLVFCCVLRFATSLLFFLESFFMETFLVLFVISVYLFFVLHIVSLYVLTSELLLLFFLF